VAAAACLHRVEPLRRHRQREVAAHLDQRLGEAGRLQQGPARRAALHGGRLVDLDISVVRPVSTARRTAASSRARPAPRRRSAGSTPPST
jgi:hypothetical protein